MFWMTSFILSSASMLLLNKLAAAAVPRCRFALLSVQGLACVLLNYLGAKACLCCSVNRLTLSEKGGGDMRPTETWR